MRRKSFFVLTVLLSLLLFSSTGFSAQALSSSASELDARVRNALRVLREIQKVPENGIPEYLFSQCYGLAVFPSVYKGGFVIGASYGKGILVARDPKTGRWSGPIFLTLGSGSFGWQIGVQASDLVLVIMNQRGLNALLKSKMTLGGDLSVAAGPVGRKLEAATDLTLKAEVYSYSRSKGFFAGLSLKGAYLKQDYTANELYYGKAITPREILFHHTVEPPAGGRELLNWLSTLGPKENS